MMNVPCFDIILYYGHWSDCISNSNKIHIKNINIDYNLKCYTIYDSGFWKGSSVKVIKVNRR